MTRSEYRKSLSRADLKRMSTAALEELLMNDLSSQEGGELEPDGLYQAAQVLAEREGYPNSVVDRAWERFQEDYLPLVEEDEIRIPEEAREYIGIQEALEDYGFTRPVVPKWMPEGFEPRNMIVDDMAQISLIFHSLYSRDEDSLVFQVDIYLDYEGRVDGHYTNFQKDEGDPIPYEAGGVTHMLATNAGRPVAVWANGPAECALSGDITMEELKQMIDSIYEK